MATRINDRWLWLGFGIFFLAAAKGIQYAISDIVTLTELDSDNSKNDDTERPEDSMQNHKPSKIHGSSQNL